MKPKLFIKWEPTLSYITIGAVLFFLSFLMFFAVGLLWPALIVLVFSFGSGAVPLLIIILDVKNYLQAVRRWNKETSISLITE